MEWWIWVILGGWGKRNFSLWWSLVHRSLYYLISILSPLPKWLAFPSVSHLPPVHLTVVFLAAALWLFHQFVTCPLYTWHFVFLAVVFWLFHQSVACPLYTWHFVFLAVVLWLFHQSVTCPIMYTWHFVFLAVALWLFHQSVAGPWCPEWWCHQPDHVLHTQPQSLTHVWTGPPRGRQTHLQQRPLHQRQVLRGTPHYVSLLNTSLFNFLNSPCYSYCSGDYEKQLINPYRLYA